MTLFALAARGGFLGASGLDCSANRRWSSRLLNASVPMPKPVRPKKCRLVISSRRSDSLFCTIELLLRHCLIQVEQRIRGHDPGCHVGILRCGPGYLRRELGMLAEAITLAFVVLNNRIHLVRFGPSAGTQPKGERGAAGRSGSRFVDHPLRQGLGGFQEYRI